MDVRSHLASCLEEAALVVSDGSRPFTEEETESLADVLIADPKLSFALDAWDIVSIEGQEYLAAAVERVGGSALCDGDARGIAKHLLWYEERLRIVYTP